MFCLDTGTFEQKEQLLEAVLEQWGPRQGSGCYDVESTMQKSTSGNVVTPQRRDVPTKAYERRHGIPEQSDTDFAEVPGICTVFHFFDIFGY